MHFHSSIIVYTPVHCVLAVYTARPVYFMHDQCLSAVCFSPDIILRRLSCWIWRSMRGIHHPCSSCASKASLYGKIAGCVKCLQHSLTTCAFIAVTKVRSNAASQTLTVSVAPVEHTNGQRPSQLLSIVRKVRQAVLKVYRLQ